ncbi:hypothetical protein HD553DRAFT_334130 [Filobasidium floriforme]|uniref:uncharacterized protein n=1 Tax=Filobasidium floriforme TaxID=5210 RepID=UPI001E8D4B10|nr:uncharacterized protein HD553DRAFT_334130 [Filobasidium floriforme]KAH8087920.1 hypothetical protein HD553DRAFT_334130 [Filobasidium floriforme]
MPVRSATSDTTVSQASNDSIRPFRPKRVRIRLDDNSVCFPQDPITTVCTGLSKDCGDMSDVNSNGSQSTGSLASWASHLWTRLESLMGSSRSLYDDLWGGRNGCIEEYVCMKPPRHRSWIELQHDAVFVKALEDIIQTSAKWVSLLSERPYKRTPKGLLQFAEYAKGVYRCQLEDGRMPGSKDEGLDTKLREISPTVFNTLKSRAFPTACFIELAHDVKLAVVIHERWNHSGLNGGFLDLKFYPKEKCEVW